MMISIDSRKMIARRDLLVLAFIFGTRAVYRFFGLKTEVASILFY